MTGTAAERRRTVEVLYVDGCANVEPLMRRLDSLLTAADIQATLELRRVRDGDAAVSERFLGSPTVRVDGEDVDPGAARRTDFGVSCRLYATPQGLRAMPPDEWLLAALVRRRA